MKLNYFLLIFSLFTMGFSFQADAKLKDIDAAYKASAYEKKPLLIYFTNSEIKSEVLSAKEFLDKIENHFVFAEIEFSRLSKEEKNKIQEKFHLQDFPRLVLMDEKGRELSRFGILGEKPENIASEVLVMIEKSSSLTIAMSHLAEISTFPYQLEELYKVALELKRNEDADQILAIGIEKDLLFFLVEKYRLLTEKGDESERAIYRDKVIAVDPNNEKEAFFSLALIDFQALASHKSKEAIKPLEEYVERFGQTDHKNRWRLEMMIAQHYLNSDDWDTSLRHAETAFQEAPLDVKKEIARCCSYIKGHLNNALTSNTPDNIR